MNPAYSKYELIDQYLNKELSPAELDSFLEKMAHDKEFAEEVELQQLAHDYILDKEMIELKEKMQNDLNSSDAQFPYRNVIISASLIILAGATYYFIPKTNKETTKETSVSESRTTNSNLTSNKEVNNSTITTKGLKNSVSAKTTVSAISDNSTIKGNTNPEIVDNLVPIVNQAIVESVSESNSVSKTTKEAVSNVVSNACEGISFSAVINSNPSCEGKATGSININTNTIKGGNAPYQISFNKRNFSTDNNYTSLPAGTYLITIKDANQCQTQFEKEIKEEFCKKMIDDAFMPSQGDTWKYPVEENKEANIQILNEQGVLVFNTSINSGEINEWDGKNNNGAILPSGLYHFIIKFNDGKIEKGRITILR